MTRATVHGPGSRAQGDRVADTVSRGIEGGAKAFAAAAPDAGPAQIGRVRLRLPAGAGEAEIARAFADALAARGGGRKP